ncbi:MAG: asparagine synthase (glutamine-hydrolyzing) [Ignavibacteriales bacterium]|nr:asparagine synthase (glutamine-hydrolyzing) [Ignavibacteriales bacterium]
MCGITGLFNYKNNYPMDRNLSTEMVRTISHRGPDDEGFYYDDDCGVFLGHRRLSIIDLSTGNQPMTNEDETIWIVFNGEIYNFPVLREELILKGHTFRTNSDTEVIIHAYEEWGIESFSRLNGMFGFALWDQKQKKLILARDPFGIKPLYYIDNGFSVIFGSEIKPILINPEVKREINISSLYDFITYTYVPSPGTIFKNIFKIPPGYCLITNSNGSTLERFYKVIPEEIKYKNESEIVEDLQSKIFDAVKRQMISDVPIGAMLSGGVDSSTVCSIMSSITNNPIKTFTVGFTDNFKFNELKEARFTSELINSEHHELIVSSEDYNKLLPFSVWHMEEPVSTGSILAYYLICKLAREHVKVVLTGQGADEPFAGYPRHFGEYYGKYYRNIPNFIRDRILGPIVLNLPRNERIKRAVNSLSIVNIPDRLKLVYETLDSNIRQDLFNSSSVNYNDMSNAIMMWQPEVKHLDGLNQMLYVDSRLSLPDNLLLYGDKMAMAVSLEARVPFLDLDLMKLVESIPSKYKIHGTTQKYLLKKAVAKWIPKEIINRKKIGFTTPLDDWFQSNLRKEIEERLLSEGSACRQYFNLNVIRKMLNDHFEKKEDYKRALFSFLTFEIWYEQFIKPTHTEFVAKAVSTKNEFL